MWGVGALVAPCLPDQFDEPRLCVLSVPLLRAEPLRGDDHHPVIGQSLSGQPLKALPHIVGQIRRMAHVEAQLHGGRNLVDILPTGPDARMKLSSSSSSSIEIELVTWIMTPQRNNHRWRSASLVENFNRA